MTTNADTPFGLRPVRYRDGSPYNGAVNPYFVNSTYATALFIGDPVVKVAGGSNAAAVGGFPIGTLPEIQKATAGDGNAITGVIVGFLPLPNNLGLQYNTASTARVALVCDDPNVLFEIQADGAIAATAVGLNAVLIYTHAGSTVTGRSGAELDTTSDAPDADASNQLTILRVVDRADNYAATAFTKVLVAINQHTELTGAIGI
jgi:hypothetical protein